MKKIRLEPRLNLISVIWKYLHKPCNQNTPFSLNIRIIFNDLLRWKYDRYANCNKHKTLDDVEFTITVTMVAKISTTTARYTLSLQRPLRQGPTPISFTLEVGSAMLSVIFWAERRIWISSESPTVTAILKHNFRYCAESFTPPPAIIKTSCCRLSAAKSEHLIC